MKSAACHLRVIEGGVVGHAGRTQSERESRAAFREAERRVAALCPDLHLHLHWARRACKKLKDEIASPQIPPAFHNWIIAGQVKTLRNVYDELGRALAHFVDDGRGAL